ncbi:MAG: ribosomal protein S18-alanine N-acetyltransferase [Gammaproteobacteria bacterium]
MIAVVKDVLPEIRPMQHGDLSNVAELESCAYKYPWSIGIFRDCLLADYVSVVLERNSVVLGYGIMSVAAAEGHLLNLCVDVNFRRRGYGRHLLDYLRKHALESGVERLFLEVRASNQAALDLYENAGFCQLGVRKAYYKSDTEREDAVVLVCDINI